MGTVLITGITGMVGSHLADYILNEHEKIRPEECTRLDKCPKIASIFDRDMLEFQYADAIKETCKKCDELNIELFGLKRWRSPMDNTRHIKHKLNLIDGDLCDLSSILGIIQEVKPDMVFHIAAQSFVPYSYSVPAETLHINVIGTANLLEAIRLSEIKPRIHICSSPEVYGNADGVITEDCPLKPCSPYAASKVAEEAIAYSYYKAYRQHIVISRAFAHEGPRRGNVFAVSSFAYQLAMLEKYPSPKPTIYVGNLNSMRTYCDVRDTVRAYWLLLEKGKAGEVYNIAGDEEWKLKEVLDRLIELTSVEPRIIVDSKRLRPVDVVRQRANDNKFRKLTEWKPEIPFERTLEDMLNYWRERV